MIIKNGNPAKNKNKYNIYIIYQSNTKSVRFNG